MTLRKFILLLIVSTLLVSSGCNVNKANEYRFDRMADIEERTASSNSVNDYADLYTEIGNILRDEGMKGVIITVEGEEITRGDFEAAKKIFAFKYDENSVKDIVYSLVKPRVIYAEADRLKLEVSQDKIERYLEGVRTCLSEDTEASEPLYAEINGKGITEEEYMKEQENLAYNLFKKEALYEYVMSLEKDDDMTTEEMKAKYDKYVNKLLKYANIQIYDPEIKDACLQR